MTILVVGVDIKDARVWRGDNTGLYSAKSGYKWLNKEDTTILQRDITLPPMDLQTLYNRLWNLQLANILQEVGIDTSPSSQGQQWKIWDCELAACTYHNTFVANDTTAKVKAFLQAVSVAKELSF
ncbi:hypothetical protein GOBAR_DD15732 [Gossypium barbadense]|nr:hypothetical protein GOBAR_DD15732 [Gossypium barbadense]